MASDRAISPLLPLLLTIFTLFAIFTIPVFAVFSIICIAPALLPYILSESTEQLARVGGDTVDSAGVNLNAAVQGTTRLLEVDCITFLE